MNYTKAQIIEDVRRVIDENATSIRLDELSDIETLDLNQLIVATICDAAKAIESAAPLHLLDYTKPLSGAVEILTCHPTLCEWRLLIGTILGDQSTSL